MEQLECFRKGFPYLKLHAAAAVPDDILALAPESQEQYVQKWMPIVAASQSVKGNEKEREFLLSWVDVVDYE